jgi:Na+-driven multidrug efflux pump
MRLPDEGFRLRLPVATGRILRVSVPACLEEILVSVGFLTFMGMIARFGTEVLAAHATAVRIEAMSFTAGWGVAVATATMVGQALGARQLPLARRLFGLNLTAAMTIMGLFGILFCVVPGWFVSWFLLGPGVESLGIALMFIIGIQQPFIGSTMVLAGGLRGAGDTVAPFLTQIAGTIGVRIGLGWFLAYPMGMGIFGVYWATFFDWLVRTLVLAAFVRTGRWERIKV